MTDLIGRRLQCLGEQVQCRVSIPGDDGYAAATAIWAKPAGRMPNAVVHCLKAEHVRWAIRTARDGDLPISVRGGGHDWACRSLCNGIVLDLSGMSGVIADLDEQVVQISGGARMADVIDVTEPHGFVAVTGSVGSVGMAGLTLGGGYGPLIGRFGLALDNLVGAEVVLADGSIVVTDDHNEAELFWALRGGGGNFGVVTAMRHRLHEMFGVCSGMLVYPFAEARTVLRRCAELAAFMPDEFSVQVGIVGGPDGVPVVMVVPTWCGTLAEGEARLAPFLRLGTLLAGTVSAMPYGALLTAFDPYIVNGRRTFLETCWLPKLGSTAIDIFIHTMEAAVSPGCAIFTHEFKGAASRVPEEATAFGLRRDHVLVEILATCDDRSDKSEEERHWQWARTTRHAFDTLALPGAYPNLLAAGEELDRVTQSYGCNARRLIKAKRHYDPDSVFQSAIPLPVTRALVDIA
jgi:FAD binding domain/Berberine and berberine like